MSIKDELSEIWNDYVTAYRRADAEGCAAVFTDDGELFSPYGSAKGRQALTRIHADWVSEGGEDKTITVIDAQQSGDMAWCLARFSEGDESSDGTSVNVLERQHDGCWRIRLCSLNET